MSRPTPSPSAPGERLNIDRLLRIDIAAELRKLAQAQLEGPWQLPLELIRRAIRDGATEVSVRLERGRVEVSATGDLCADDVPENLATINDDHADPDAAHQAVVALENAEQLGLIALRGVAAKRIECTLPTRAGEVRVLTVSGGNVQTRAHAPPNPTGSRVLVEGVELDVRRARKEIAHAARLAEIPVHVDGHPLTRGFAEAFAVDDIPPAALDGARARVALSLSGETPVVWVLRHGIVATHLTLTAGPSVEVALEVGDSTPPRATRADLRDRVDQLAPALTSAAVDVLERQSRRTGLSQPQRTRIAELALQATKLRSLAARVAQIPLFDVLDDGLPIDRVSLMDVKAAARTERGRAVIDALGPNDDPREYECHGRVFVIDAKLRGWLSDTLDLSARPPNRLTRPGLRARWRAAIVATRRRLGALLPGAPGIDRGEWTAGELALVSTISAVLAEDRSATISATRRPRWRGRVFHLPRRDPAVVAAARLCAEQPAWAYPAALSLMGPHLRVREARRGWSIRVWADPRS
jgi:hypothetical protein